MKLKKILPTILVAAGLFSGVSCSNSPNLEITLPEKFEGQTVDIVNFLDSTTIASGIVENGKVKISHPDTTPIFTAVIIDGRTRAFYILEKGAARLNDSISSATGTPLNDEFSRFMTRLDSVDALDNMELYIDFVNQEYDKFKNTPIGEYLGIECLKYAKLQQIDSILDEAPKLADSPKAQYYKRFAELRDATAPGKRYVDFAGETEKGKPTKLSSYVNDKGFTLVDFWAAWCPYCIKELPEIAALQEKWAEPILRVVGVAVRDVPEDTKALVNKHDISWPVIYNTQRLPYDIYGFSGIPHHMLIGADGTILSRGESIKQIDSRIEQLLKQASLETGE